MHEILQVNIVSAINNNNNNNNDNNNNNNNNDNNQNTNMNEVMSMNMGRSFQNWLIGKRYYVSIILIAKQGIYQFDSTLDHKT